jgi:hypothetical protein
MYPRIVKVTLILPWHPPQTVLVRELMRGIYRLQLTDRYGRIVNYAGTDIGFGVKLFKSTRNQSYLVVKGLWDEALYASESDKKPSHVTILDIETDDC